VVGKDTPAVSLEDLGGLTIGSHSKLTIHYLLMMNIIKSEGIRWSAPINLEIHPLGEMIGKLKSGAVQGFIMPEPINAVAAANGVGRIIKLSREIWPDHPCCLLAARKDFADGNPALMQSVTLALLEAALFADRAENRDEFIDTIRQVEAYGKMPKPVLQKAFAPGRADFAPFLYRSSASVVARLMQKFMLLPGTVSRQEVESRFDSEGTAKLYAEAGGTAPDAFHRDEVVLGKALSF